MSESRVSNAAAGGASESRLSNAAAGAALALAIGLGWYLIEGAAGLAGDVPGQELRARFLRFLPWQLVLFAALGLGVAVLTRLRALPLIACAWLVVAGATFVFLGARVAEGTLHAYPLPVAVLRVAVLGALLGLLAAALAGVARLLDSSRRVTWHAGVLAFWSTLFILYLRRAGPSIGLGEFDAGVAWNHLAAVDAFAAAVTAAIAAGIASRSRSASLAVMLFASLVPIGSGRISAAARPSPPAQGDVIVLLLDTLRADHLGARPDGSSRTPHLDAFAPEFFRFSEASSPSTRTSRSMPGIMTSLSMGVTGAILPDEAVTLAERLHEGGWSTHGISANPLVSRQFGYHQGFDELTGLADSPDFLILALLKLVSAALPGPTYHLGIADAEFYYPRVGRLGRTALRMLDRAEPPTFLYVQTMDAHGPYLPPRDFLAENYQRRDFLSYFRLLRLSDSEQLLDSKMQPKLENLRQRYAGEVSYMESEVAALFADLQSRGRWDEATVWILSDHGEAFGEHGFAGHGQPYVGTSIVRVPFWLKPPRSAGLSPRPIDATVSTFDLLPTTLALLGLPPLEESFGEDLTPLLSGATPAPERTVVSETNLKRGRLHAAVRGRWKLDRHSWNDGSSRRALFDLETDPGETTDVAADHPDTADSLEEAILLRIRDEERLAFEKKSGAVDDQMRERLRALGYVDD